MKTILGVLSQELNKVIPYEFMQWTASLRYPYWVGEIAETASDNEDGCREFTAIVTGTTRGSWLELEDDRAKVEDHFPSIYGLRVPTDDGAVVIFYENSSPVPTGEADLKRLQINLRIIHLKGMN